VSFISVMQPTLSSVNIDVAIIVSRTRTNCGDRAFVIAGPRVHDCRTVCLRTL